MNKFKRAFTKWYVKKGYTFGYESTYPLRAYWVCPCWIRPLLFLFSPSVYGLEAWAKPFVEGFTEGFERGVEENEDNDEWRRAVPDTETKEKRTGMKSTETMTTTIITNTLQGRPNNAKIHH